MTDRDHHFMQMAARLALRGHGGAEPNPLVGCVIIDRDGQRVGWGYHRRCGGAHAEIAALHRAGRRAAGATAYVTLEPCNHTGRTGPCADALIAAGIARVVIARHDPNPTAGGGAARLQAAGIQIDYCESVSAAVRLTDPFVHRLSTGLPWITAKWAQTIDGRIATRTGDSRWISGARSRAMVHRERGRVDAVMTGIGTVLADDPLLTARNVRVRRQAHRIIIDPLLKMPVNAQIARTAHEIPTVVVCRKSTLRMKQSAASSLREQGMEVIGASSNDAGPIPLAPVLRRLASERDWTHVLVEAGPGLLSALFHQQLVQDAWVFIAPLILGDDESMAAVRGTVAPAIADATRLQVRSVRRRGSDIVAHYGCAAAAAAIDKP